MHLTLLCVLVYDGWGSEMGERDKKLDAWLAEQTSKPEATSIEDRLEAADPPSKQCVIISPLYVSR
jgi:hypothetical protein